VREQVSDQRGRLRELEAEARTSRDPDAALVLADLCDERGWPSIAEAWREQSKVWRHRGCPCQEA
jgi:hypothetical protein